MKKIIASFLMFVCLLSVSGCFCSKKDENILFVQKVKVYDPDMKVVDGGFDNDDPIIQEIKEMYDYNLDKVKYEYYPKENIVKKIYTDSPTISFESTYYVFSSGLYQPYVEDGELKYERVGDFYDGVSAGTSNDGHPVRMMSLRVMTAGPTTGEYATGGYTIEYIIANKFFNE